jgi:hypothetical protein
MKKILGLLTGLGLAGTGHAFMDGYQDRKGVYVGAALGGGTGRAKPDGGGSTSAAGFQPSARVGIGGSKDLGLDIETAFFRGTDQGTEQKQLSATLNLQKFLTQELYVRGGFGFANGTLETTPALADKTQSGTAFTAGVGYEIFLNTESALNIGGVYRSSDYDTSSFRYVGLQVGWTWY